MKVLSSALLIIFAALATAVHVRSVHAQSIHALFGTDKFHRAYFDANTNDITFEPFQELDWEAEAHSAVRWLSLDRPTPAQIARLSASESAGPQFRSVDFRAPLAPAVRSAAYLLIHAAGILPLAPVQLKGSVAFDFDTTMTVVERKVISGVIVARPSRLLNSAAFAVIGKPADLTDVVPGTKLEKRKQAGLTVFDLTEGGGIVSWTTSSNEQLDAASALSFRLAGARFLLVKWNTELCGSAYTLFSVNTRLNPIAGNDYDCDP
jgi:hypothetical protein